MAQTMPMELVNMIFAYVVEFHRVDAIQRTNEMRDTYRDPWSLVMSDIRANVPRYSLTLTGYNGQPISIYCPDCTIRPLGGPPGWLFQPGLPSGVAWQHPTPWQVISRRALSTWRSPPGLTCQGL